MFDAPASTALQGAGGKDAEGGSDDEDDEDEGDDDDPEGRAREKEKAGAGKGAVGAAVLAMLQRVAEEQAEEIAAVCRRAHRAQANHLPEPLHWRCMRRQIQELRGHITRYALQSHQWACSCRSEAGQGWRDAHACITSCPVGMRNPGEGAGRAPLLCRVTCRSAKLGMHACAQGQRGRDSGQPAGAGGHAGQRSRVTCRPAKFGMHARRANADEIAGSLQELEGQI